MSVSEEISKLIALRDSRQISSEDYDVAMAKIVSDRGTQAPSTPAGAPIPSGITQPLEQGVASELRSQDVARKSHVRLIIGIAALCLAFVVTVVVVLLAGSKIVYRATHNYSLQSACFADAKTVETAVSAYNAQFTPGVGREVVGNNSGDIVKGVPSTYANGKQAQLLLGQGLVKTWPGTSNGYAISLSTTKPGNVSVYVPANSTTAMDFESQSSITGCNSI